jgi:hypothetical protein
MTLKLRDRVYEVSGTDPVKVSIKAIDNHDDLAGYGMLGLHDVNKKLARPKTDPSELLSDYVIQKYGNALDFLNF